ncbi:hypothetical protein JCM19037_2188 [Geomicrobium sp. JCM 19037]|nr:hypothetical protein JCM19037_2188 [Geomicrobium sp. JCM 19037]
MEKSLFAQLGVMIFLRLQLVANHSNKITCFSYNGRAVRYQLMFIFYITVVYFLFLL